MSADRSAWPAPLATTEVSLVAADVQAARGDRDSVLRLLGLARTEARRDLAALDSWYLAWPEWGRFEDACDVEGWARWFPWTGLLRRHVDSACRAFLELAARAERVSSEAGTESNAGDALEDLLVAVWRCEREWTLDDRIDRF
jgi:hypothetical protein